MMNRKSLFHKLLLLPVILLLVINCSVFGIPENEEPGETVPPEANPSVTFTPTPTPTTLPLIPETEVPENNRCKGLSGEIEIWVIVGPAEAVGLEPFAVGSAPFSVVGAEPPYAVEGGGMIDYYDLLEEKWGTYEVTFAMDTTIIGQCSGETGGESLSLVLEATGEQNVIVDAVGFHGEYPWAGTHSFNLAYPLEDGASIEGEGYNFVLHLNQ